MMAIQMVCPFCKKEFPFNNGYLDAEISKIGQEIAALNREIAIINASRDRRRPEQKKRKAALAVKLAEKSQRISELKTIRKATDQQRRNMEYELFKTFTREKYGDEAYRKILELVEEGLQAYSISGMMKHEYTRSHKLSSVTSINKL